MSDDDYGEMQPVADELLRRMRLQRDAEEARSTLPDVTEPEFNRLKAQKDAIIQRSTVEPRAMRDEIGRVLCSLHAEVIAATAVRIARAIVEEVKRTQPVNPQNLEQK